MIIKSRADWGARPPLSPPKQWTDGPHDLVVHWVGGAGTMGLTSPDKVPAAIRAIQAYEQSHGYSDIAYSLVLDPFGQLWNGRSLQYAGAANGPATNGTKPSVCLLLNKADQMTVQMKDTIRQLRRELTPGLLLGHREVNLTFCPGDDVMRWIQSERIVPNPVPPSPLPKIEDEMTKLIRGSSTPSVFITNGIVKRHVTAAAYGGWLIVGASVPGMLNAGKEWVWDQAFVDSIPTV